MKGKILLLALAMGFAIVSTAFAEDDFGYRAASAVSMGLADNWSATWYEEHNITDNTELYASHVHELSATYFGVTPWLNLTAAYCHVFGRVGRHKWADTVDPWVSATFHKNIKGFGLANQVRMDYCDRENGAGNGGVFKNVSSVTLPWKVTKLEIQPYFSDEINYDLRTNQLCHNEFRSGFNFKINDMIGMTIYYRLAHDQGDDTWARSHMLATQINVAL